MLSNRVWATFLFFYTGQPVLAQELEDSVGAKFYCPQALAQSSSEITKALVRNRPADE